MFAPSRCALVPRGVQEPHFRNHPACSRMLYGLRRHALNERSDQRSDLFPCVAQDEATEPLCWPRAARLGRPVAATFGMSRAEQIVTTGCIRCYLTQKPAGR